MTYTLNDTLGNRTVVPGVGVVLNNEMDDFAVEPGAANAYGLVQGESNAVRAGRAAALVHDADDRSRGRPSAPRRSARRAAAVIPTTVLQVYLNAARRGEPLGEAVAARRFHHQHLPDRIELETRRVPGGREGRPAREGPRSRRARTRSTRSGMLGRVHAIAFEKDGSLTAAADPRGYGAAAGP